MKNHRNKLIDTLGSDLSKGLLAGLAATAAITISQMIEMKITKRGPSEAPVKVASETMGIKPADKNQQEKVSQEIHWTYGTVWGIPRAIIGFTGLKGLTASLIHFGTVWGTALFMLPKFDAAPPVNKQEPGSVAIDGLHHAVYALTAGLVFDALNTGFKKESRFDKVLKFFNVK